MILDASGYFWVEWRQPRVNEAASPESVRETQALYVSETRLPLKRKRQNPSPRRSVSPRRYSSPRRPASRRSSYSSPRHHSSRSSPLPRTPSLPSQTPTPSTPPLPPPPANIVIDKVMIHQSKHPDTHRPATIRWDSFPAYIVPTMRKSWASASALDVIPYQERV
ncbi:hypothetical protein B9479_005665 [Cryptococcus floricola]|uniref:Uncharacterized protein n=1 Tax=Cryptococcus floricola TaxID=2591691 RepID=A0A5D3ASK5_9TREE|nr:hypothetical protein B9479_005665 [Cryptococcus floricola]